jgi:hypothetical protein
MLGFGNQQQKEKLQGYASLNTIDSADRLLLKTNTQVQEDWFKRFWKVACHAGAVQDGNEDWMREAREAELIMYVSEQS